ncbi:MAG: hypothetical protein V1743_02295 [Nanoarchaeota archaeon]
MPDPYVCDRIMQKIDPQVLAEKVGEPNFLARESFPLIRNKVSGHPELVSLLTRYVQHHYQYVGLGDYWPDDMAFGQAEFFLRQQGLSIQRIYDDAIRGLNGGVSKILTIVAEQIEREHAQRYIDYVFATEIDQLDYEEIEELMQAFIRKFGQYLPYHLRSVPALMQDWKTILIETAKSQSRLRAFTGRY